MIRRFRSLLIDQVNVRIPGLHILTFAVHRHLPELTAVEPHKHVWSQAILYLNGKGRQSLAAGKARVEPGTLVLLPPGVSHSFAREEGRTPLCLMIDFRLKGARKHRASVCSVNRSELSQIRQNLAYLMGLQTEGSGGGARRWESSVVVQQLLIALLRSAGWLERVKASGHETHGRAMEELLKKMELDRPLGEVIRRSGYQRDHLNRLVKKETGLTLGQYRARQRLSQAKQLLSQGMQVASVATSVGLPDQNYFARWFRRQTGQPPSVWT